AINRGERSHVLRVRILADDAALEKETLEVLVPGGHPHAEFLQECAKDALSRLVAPSLERELRREMTEKAEHHAVDVFVRNLRKLLLQPPVHGRRVLAVDPGFRSGCKLAALDEFGNLLDHTTIHIIGPEQHRQLCRARLVDVINKFQLSVIAVGNGTACRETEALIADVLGTELKDRNVEYVIVNEAGASVYSTSPIGREELPKFDATVRGAVSIGRRLLDPLSELVKINPANIGVGLYQHDLKAKHLRESLDAVVESCVNYVGVDVNTASPALLRYVSGLNQLTARRLYEYRLQHGPFRTREQLKEVPGFGDATFVQSAGFLKIYGGDSPLDATWIHPESYDAARKVLTALESSEAEVAEQVAPSIPPPGAAADAGQPGSAFGAGDPHAVLAAVEAAASATTSEGGAAATATDAPASDAPATDAPATDSSSAGPDEAAATTAETPEAEQPAAAPELATASEPAAPKAEPVLVSRIAKVDPQSLAKELSIGSLLLKDILASLARPQRDPREDLPPPV
ncbi:MAG TPA: helix-hairpin-helix domain-containing protein, partial [Pirellulaceae bacterium]|nr:helix-hairpin-helix domain-containing protein [Pirellulaceae bacterium]